MWKKLKPYVISVITALLVGGISALLTSGSMDIYDTVQTPPLSPPAIIFPIVWTILFTLMGIGSAIVYVKGKEEDIDISSALGIYLLQLAVNFFWSIIFFNMRAFLFAFIWILLLWILIIVMIKRFYEISPLAAYLQIPYLLWVTFAAYLNLAIYILNR